MWDIGDDFLGASCFLLGFNASCFDTSGFFLGQYKILDQLGQGGMGRVYKAIHLTMKRVVALKVLAPQHLTPKDAR